MVRCTSSSCAGVDSRWVAGRVVDKGTREASIAQVFRDALVGHVRVTLGGHDG